LANSWLSLLLLLGINGSSSGALSCAIVQGWLSWTWLVGIKFGSPSSQKNQHLLLWDEKKKHSLKVLAPKPIGNSGASVIWVGLESEPDIFDESWRWWYWCFFAIDCKIWSYWLTWPMRAARWSLVA
jgi:hypothetical protein